MAGLCAVFGPGSDWKGEGQGKTHERLQTLLCAAAHQKSGRQTDTEAGADFFF